MGKCESEMGVTLVTGASGFVGSHLIAEMARRAIPARGVTRGMAPHLRTIPSYGEDMAWQEHLKQVDTIVHLAARVHVMRETAADPLSQFRQSNVAATVNIARQAAVAGVRRFVFVSSIKVNGERTEPWKPFTATAPYNPQDFYGLSKAEAEMALMEVGAQTGLEITIVRPPLVYGAGVRGNFRSLMKWAASGIPSIFAAVENKRSFIYVENLCDLLISTLAHPNAANRVFLASDAHDVSTHELLTQLTIAAGRQPRGISLPPAVLRSFGALIRRKEAMARLTEHLQVDITHTHRELNWHPPVPFAKAVTTTTLKS